MNVSSIKTPGVYINEIDAFPPSVAQVATAIPAFLGYTEKGPAVPTRIKSFMEFEQTFGGAPAPKSITVVLDENGQPSDDSKAVESKFQLYNSLKLFYENGGGVCYIVSVGKYMNGSSVNTISENDFFGNSPKKGINLLENVDEPTLILFPDAVNVESTDAKKSLGNIQKQALMQCEKLMDRFVIMDVIQKDGLDQDLSDFRDAIGNSALKYGAAYYPNLISSVPKSFRFADIQGNGVDFKVLYPGSLSSINNFEALNSDLSTLEATWEALSSDKTKPASAVSNESEVNSYVTKCWNLLGVLKDSSAINNADFESYISDSVKTSLKPVAQNLFDFEAKYDSLSGINYTLVMDSTLDNTFSDADWKNSPATDFQASTQNAYDKRLTSNPDSADDAAHYGKISSELDKLHSMIVNTINSLMQKSSDYELKIENDLTSQLPAYSAVINKLNQSMNIIPPSGAMAGIYSKTDATRGVWKAPANVSVNSIVGITEDINDADQENMNIHETGKSVNAIRNFSGKGFLVWGGRTLAGNSNDWRYINVRRLAIMIEESVKKACMQFIFEPNVAQTWVSVKGMIDNYLTLLWNDGALAGSKPQHAFFVSVGLNETMSAQDILEGRIIVKIGYAPSRPAEFIILEFKQMQQRS
ncbi:phage tail sheath C-terminal domain-containing protein [Chryseobacterium sp.]|uniref:phage tail sheath family protein n=1 Tax=Chryseobacterium sp. TaxID=1871047 RepID=UPI0028A2DC1F|nr:phage tail sheath C-terminal domain-containing protein [Chryseobacterium sp.]